MPTRRCAPIRAAHSAPIPRGAPYIAQIVEDMARLLDHLNIGQTPILSLGGDSFIAIAFHAAYPERVRALICCGASLLPRPCQGFSPA